MRKEIINIIAFFAVSVVTIGFNVWPVFIPYYYSYLKHFNPYITVEQVFATTFFLYLGMNVISMVMPVMLFLFGIKGTMRAGGVFILLNSISIYYFTGWFFICLNILVFGGMYRYVTLLSIVYFSEHFPSQASNYYGIALSGFLVGSIISNNVCSFIINPENLPMNQETNINGFTEVYFDFSIASNMRQFLNLFGMLGLFVSIFCSFLIENPEKYQGELLYILGWGGKKKKDINESIKVFKNNLDETFSEAFRQNEDNTLNQSLSLSMKSNVFTSVNIRKSKLKQQLEEELVEEEMSQFALESEDPNDAYNRHKKSLIFWVIFYVALARNAQPSYLLENYKIQAYCVRNDDVFFTRIFSISAFFGALGSIYASYIWKTIGMINSYYLALILNMVVNLLLMTVAPHSTLVFSLITFLGRTYSSYNIQVNNMSMFSVYDSSVALKLSKIFDLNFFLGVVLGVFLNFWLVFGCNFRFIYLIFFCIESIGLILVYKYLDKRKED